MSISFSGLASGLDTTQWVESLTALKQAKVSSLQEEKENVLLSQETLNSIKTFFASFRSVIERVTDTKFNIVSMDLFAQNIATSANLSVLTANATQEAEEGTYQVQVDKLATNTKVTSNYTRTEEIEETTTATLDSKLMHLGVNSGIIGVNVDGTQEFIRITNTDTIATFIEKLKDIGVEASYNERSGIFSMNVDAGDITDIDGTGIIEAFHLEGVSEGYKTSTKLEISATEIVYQSATADTKLSALGVSAGIVTIAANDQEYEIEITDESTLGSFIQDLTDNHIDAVLDATGVFTLSDAEIVDEGSTNILDALGLEVDIYAKTQQSNSLALETTIVETTIAKDDTLLKDIGEGTTLTVEVEDENGVLTTITVGETTNIGGLISQMNSAGMNVTLNADGTVEITEGRIVGGTLDVEALFNLAETAGGIYATSTALNAATTVTVEASESTVLGRYGISDEMSETERTVNLYTSEGTLLGSTVVTADTEIGELLDWSTSLGVTATLAEGVVTFSDGYIENAAIESAMGLAKNNDSSYVLGSLVSVPTEIVATESTSFASLGISDTEFTIKGQDGIDVDTLNANTIGEFFSELEVYGINASIDNGVITISSTNGNYITGALADALGISRNSETVTDIAVQTATSTEAITIKTVTKGGPASPYTAYIDTATGSIVGSGTVLIATEAEFLAMNGKTYSGNSSFILGCDVTIEDSDNWIGVKFSIGSTRNFDGNGHEIIFNNVTVNASEMTDGNANSEKAWGLFDGMVDVSNLKLSGNVTINCDVDDTIYVGALMGSTKYSYISMIDADVYFDITNNTSDVTSLTIGGLIGYSGMAQVYESSIDTGFDFSTSNNSLADITLGGVVGYSEGLSVYDTKLHIHEFAEPYSYANAYIGGVYGYSDGDECYNNMIFTGDLISVGATGNTTISAITGSGYSSPSNNVFDETLGDYSANYDQASTILTSSCWDHSEGSPSLNVGLNTQAVGTATRYVLPEFATINTATGSVVGSGTVLISTQEEFLAMDGKTYGNQHIILGCNITISDSWTGIELINSTFDGNGHDIIFGDITVNMASTDEWGLFKSTRGGVTIQNLNLGGTVEFTSVTDSNYACAIGGLVGYNNDTLNIQNIGIPDGYSDISFYFSRGSICTSSAEISIGGLVGYDGYEVNISQANVVSDISLYDADSGYDYEDMVYVGNLIGFASGGSIVDCYSNFSNYDYATEGGKWGTYYFGGLIGNMNADMSAFTIERVVVDEYYAADIVDYGAYGHIAGYTEYELDDNYIASSYSPLIHTYDSSAIGYSTESGSGSSIKSANYGTEAFESDSGIWSFDAYGNATLDTGVVTRSLTEEVKIYDNVATTIITTATVESTVAELLGIGSYTITGTINSDGSISGGDVVEITQSNIGYIQAGMSASNRYSGVTFVLTEDITLDSSWMSYDMENSTDPLVFAGTLDGQGYHISLGGNALFQGLSGTVKNVILDGSVSNGVYLPDYAAGDKSAIGAAACVTYSGAEIDNVKVSATVSGNATSMGGIVGAINGDTSIKNSTFAGSLSSTGTPDSLGGIAGQTYCAHNDVTEVYDLPYNVVIENCSMTGNVTGEVNAGGIIGCGEGLTINNCSMTGTVNGTYGGGIGATISGTISNCYIAGTVIGDSYSNTGSIIYTGDNDTTISNCIVDATNHTYTNAVTAGASSATPTVTNIISTNDDSRFDVTVAEQSALGSTASSAGFDSSIWNLDDSSGVGIKDCGANLGDRIITIVKDGEEIEYQVSHSQSIQDVMDDLYDNYGIIATFADGKISIEGSSDAYVSGVSDDLADLFNIEAGEGKNYTKSVTTNYSNTDSDVLIAEALVAITDDTRLEDIGITNGNIIITQEGVDQTVMIDTTTVQTVRDFRDLLEDEYGFKTTLDNQGRLSITGVGQSYLSNAGTSPITLDVGIVTNEISGYTARIDTATGSIVGSGTVLIATEAEFLAMAGKTYNNVDFVLGCDVTISGTWQGANLVGSTFNGNGKTITFDNTTLKTNLNSSSGNVNAGGLFADVKNSKITNMKLTGTVAITTSSDTSSVYNVFGALAGYAGNFTNIAGIDSNVLFDIGGASMDLLEVGGLVGYADSVTISRSSIITDFNFSGILPSITLCAGGTVGHIDRGGILDCYTEISSINNLSDDLYEEIYIGGIAGELSYANYSSLAKIYVSETVPELSTVNYGYIAGKSDASVLSSIVHDASSSKIGGGSVESSNNTESLVSSTFLTSNGWAVYGTLATFNVGLSTKAVNGYAVINPTNGSIVGTGTVLISTEEEFLALNGQTLTGDVILGCDITIDSSDNWTGINLSSCNFDGNGHQITFDNVILDLDNTSEWGLFTGGMYSGITNLSLTGNIAVKMSTSDAYNVGALVSNLQYGSSISHIKSDVNIAVTGGSAYECYIGGIVGSLGSSTTIAYCSVEGSFNLGALNSSPYIGGIAGYLDNAYTSDTYITNCYVNLEDLGFQYTNSYIGLLVGETSGDWSTFASNNYIDVGVLEGLLSLVGVFANYHGSAVTSNDGTNYNNIVNGKGKSYLSAYLGSGQMTASVNNLDQAGTILTDPCWSFNSNILDTFGITDWSLGDVIQTSNALDDEDIAAGTVTMQTKLKDLVDSSGNNLGITSGDICIDLYGTDEDIVFSIDNEWTLETLASELSAYGINVSLQGNTLVFESESTAMNLNGIPVGTESNILEKLKITNAVQGGDSDYIGTPISVITSTTSNISATKDTLLSDLGVTTGEYYIYNNGVKYTAFISTDETVGSLINTLERFGLATSFVDAGESSIITLAGNGNSYIAQSASANASNVVEKLFNDSETTYKYSGLLEGSMIVTTWSSATEDTLLSYYDNEFLVAEGNLIFDIDGEEKVVSITADETFGSLVNKLRDIGLEATFTDGELLIQSGTKTFSIKDTSTSSLPTTINLEYKNSTIGGFCASKEVVEQTISYVETKTLSVASFANEGTKLGDLGVTGGSFTIYRDGVKAQFDIDPNKTIGDLRDSIAQTFTDVVMEVDEDGYLKIYSNTAGIGIQAGTSTDTSNISSVLGFKNDESGAVMSARKLYKVTTDSKVTEEGLFSLGNVTEGTFIIGDGVFSIDENTTLKSLISQINSSQEANATAQWDTNGGKLIITSRITGASLINIEAGTSNFTDIMGLTTSQWDASGNLTETKINIENQEIGDNAEFAINGTYYTSTSNIIGSDVSRIKGLTLNLKGVSEGATVEVKVEKDKDTLANALSDVVDAYNDLIENVDKQIASGSPLDDQTTLRLIRNQIRNLMTGSITTSGVFKNLSSIGISLDAADATNLSTANINRLTFDKEKFINAFNADADSLKALLVGTESNLGILSRVENVVESAVAGATGFFATADNSYKNQVQRLDDKIIRAQKAVERYRERLTAKFQTMDLLISNIQNQYSSFLGGF